MLKTDALGALLEVDMSKSARRCGAKHISKSKVQENEGYGALLRGRHKGLCTLSKVSKT